MKALLRSSFGPIDDLEFAEAAVLSMAYGASMHALFDRAQLREGETIVVIGATGGVGLAAVEPAALAGARVLALAREKGAQAMLNYQTGSLRDACEAFMGGAGVDVILDPVGGELGDAAVRRHGWRGRYLVFGFASGSFHYRKRPTA